MNVFDHTHSKQFLWRLFVGHMVSLFCLSTAPIWEQAGIQ